MRILLLGSGGREHALALGIIQSPKTTELFVAPGNGGMEALDSRCHCVPLDINSPSAVTEFVSARHIDLTVIGPEAPLAAGVADALSQTQSLVFGPTQQAAELESSKAAAKAFMARWDLPTAESRTFRDFDSARAFLGEAPWPVVIKASGLAAGKGVILPESEQEAIDALEQMMLKSSFGDAGQTVVIEERMSGPEVSLLCFSDGKNIAVMPTARDHKRLLDGDEGLNTGGMGAFAPVPGISHEDTQAWSQAILQPAIAGLKAEGRPYIGVLYAGLMLTADGPKLLEFNCRFGDPEAQVLLPLLDCDLVELMTRCATGTLDPKAVKWHDKSAATVVMASAGYPKSYKKGYAIQGITSANAHPDCHVFQAGTKVENEELVTSGGRVLCVTALGATLELALGTAYEGIKLIQFEGAHYRTDIGRSAAKGGD